MGKDSARFLPQNEVFSALRAVARPCPCRDEVRGKREGVGDPPRDHDRPERRRASQYGTQAPGALRSEGRGSPTRWLGILHPAGIPRAIARHESQSPQASSRHRRSPVTANIRTTAPYYEEER
jgi:hypothetical protein